jgi:hypothetical protein
MNADLIKRLRHNKRHGVDHMKDCLEAADTLEALELIGDLDELIEHIDAMDLCLSIQDVWEPPIINDWRDTLTNITNTLRRQANQIATLTEQVAELTKRNKYLRAAQDSTYRDNEQLIAVLDRLGDKQLMTHGFDAKLELDTRIEYARTRGSE